MAGVKKNFVYNMILTVGNYLFPLLVFPYVTRILGVENFGICNYVDSIINYAVLFSALGVTSYGVREIARVKSNPREMSEVFSTLLFFNIVMTLVMSVVLIALTFTVSYLEPYRQFLLVGLSKLIFSSLLVEWFFEGMAEFRYITIRSLAIRTLYVISVFIFVRTSEDSIVFFALTMLHRVVNAVYNINYSRKFVSFKLKYVRIKAHLVPIISYGLYILLTSMYTNFNVTYLGSVTSNTEVGYFATATKLHGVILNVFTAFTTVMVPKVSEMLSKGEHESLKVISNKTFDLIFIFSFPLIIVCCFYAPLFIDIIAGDSYSGAVLPFRIVMILILVIGLEQIIIQQFLMAAKDSKCIVILSLVGAIIGVMSNIILVPLYQSVGSAISWALSEVSILILSLHYFRSHFNMGIPFKRALSRLLVCAPYLIICFFMCDNSLSLKTLMAFCLMGVWFFVSNLYVVPSETFTEVFHIKIFNR